MCLLILILVLLVDMLILSSKKETAVHCARVGTMVRQPASRERAEGGGS